MKTRKPALRGLMIFLAFVMIYSTACSFGRSTYTPIISATPALTGTPAATDTPSPTETPAATDTPAPTDTPAATDTPSPTETPAATDTPTPTNTPTPTDTPTPTNTPKPTNTPTLTNTPAPTQGAGDPTQRREGFIPANERFLESYFAIIKERLQTYKDDIIGNTLINSSFASYETVFKAEDYADYTIKDGKVIFTFSGKTLTGTEHPTFTYSCDYSEAKAFMLYDENGYPINRPQIRELDTTKKMIALTFDDGPNPVYDPQISEVLLKHNARATFFIITYKCAKEEYKQSVLDLKAAGHEIASHEYGHEFIYESTSKKNIWTQVNRANLDLAGITGEAPIFIRMAGGLDTPYLRNVPMPQIGWTWGSLDWEDRDRKEGETKEQQYQRKLNQTYKNITAYAMDGGIMLLHVNYAEEPEAVDKILTYLDQHGYICVTMSELFYYKGVTPENGKRYGYLGK